MTLDLVALSRLQFALTIMFHYLFPPLTIGLAWILVCMDWQRLRRGGAEADAMARFWTGLFAVNFAMGTATGIVMEFQFGTNWASYARFVGDVFGSALAAEGIFAFFLESGFLAVLVFGWDRVSPRLHFFSTLMVALGSTFSAVWIIIANSWQQTPAGYHLVVHNGVTRAEITDFWAVVFNPSSMHHLNHAILGACVLGAFFVLSVSAYYVLNDRHVPIAKRSFAIALWFAAAASLALPISGDLQARMVARTQPAKLAAYEGLFQTTRNAPLSLMGLPDEAASRLRFNVGVPGLLSFLVHGDASSEVTGLDKFPVADRPPVAASFLTYHAMVGLGFAFIALTLYALWLLRRGTLFKTRWLLWGFVFAVVGPFAANELGWVATEVGRQPWIVYGLMRTADGVSKSVAASQVLISIILFSLIYLSLFAVWVFVLDSKIRKGPSAGRKPGAPEGFLEAAGGFLRGESLTEGKDEEAAR